MDTGYDLGWSSRIAYGASLFTSENKAKEHFGVACSEVYSVSCLALAKSETGERGERGIGCIKLWPEFSIRYELDSVASTAVGSFEYTI